LSRPPRRVTRQARTRHPTGPLRVIVAPWARPWRARGLLGYCPVAAHPPPAVGCVAGSAIHRSRDDPGPL